jgi:diguanylate cyclase (GGDEF)-like protein
MKKAGAPSPIFPGIEEQPMPFAAGSSLLTRRLVSLLERRATEPAFWKQELPKLEEKHGPEVYRELLYVLTHLDFSARRAKGQWMRAMATWEKLIEKMGRGLDVRVAVLYHFLGVQRKLRNPAVVEIVFLQKAEDSVIVDDLTRLYNYRYFRHRLEQEVKRVRRYDRGMSLLMVDVDDFKWFNDKNGHLAGNQTLRKLGTILKESVREVDIVCRYGGEEFAVILPATLKGGALTVGEKIRRRVEKARFAGGSRQPKGKVTVSVGVATIPTDAQGMEPLIERADSALYRAKSKGKNRVEAYSDDRREFERFDVRIQGRLFALDDTPVTFETSNVSQGGMLFRSTRAVPVGSLVHVEMRLPGGTDPMKSTARVVRVEEGDGAYEIGVRTIHAEPSDLFVLRKFLDELPRR